MSDSARPGRFGAMMIAERLLLAARHPAAPSRTARQRADERTRIKVAPLTIGDGIPLFSRKAAFDPRTWTLTDHTVLKSSALILTYTRATS
ncbi:hypothetical protein [Streptomyces mexicanus]|uniref:Uncharacterized protein n=1 Tax=Streptomyces mexicanus TaxID=178566 RepID=A0A7X1I3K5_9ACTN|nr:hypothetical protein [Streptomyces mexicanus]MBC2867033.1 hypothetical protein [Streptomyces mexicanus]